VRCGPITRGGSSLCQTLNIPDRNGQENATSTSFSSSAEQNDDVGVVCKGLAFADRVQHRTRLSDELTYDRVVQRAAATTNHAPEGVVAVEVADGGDVVVFGTAEARGDGVADWGSKAKARAPMQVALPLRFWGLAAVAVALASVVRREDCEAQPSATEAEVGEARHQL
jgi:hypothetical protein